MKQNANQDKTCEICKKSFTRKQNVEKHVKTVHENMKDFECNPCEKRFSLKNHLETHFKLVHEKIKAYKCSFCAKSFGQNWTLTGLLCKDGCRPPTTKFISLLAR